MNQHVFPFGKIIILQNDIAEVIIDEGIDMDLDMVKAYHGILHRYLSAPFSLLINKIHTYSYTYEAQQVINTLQDIHAIAVVSYNEITEKSTLELANFPRRMKWNMQIFDRRQDALEWLISEQKNIRQHFFSSQNASIPSTS